MKRITWRRVLVALHPRNWLYARQPTADAGALIVGFKNRLALNRPMLNQPTGNPPPDPGPGYPVGEPPPQPVANGWPAAAIKPSPFRSCTDYYARRY